MIRSIEPSQQTMAEIELKENEPVVSEERALSSPSLEEGTLKYRSRHNLSWQKLTICLIVEAIALGTLGMPKAFACIGLIPGILLSICLGCTAIYTSYVIGQVKLKYPHVMDYAQAVKLIFGRWGDKVASVMFVSLLVLLLGSHTLTGTLAFQRLVENTGFTPCGLAWGAISAVILCLLALPPTFEKFAVYLGYIDFLSIIAAIGITIIASGIAYVEAPIPFESRNWNWGPPPNISFREAFLGSTNMIFAYTFAVAQFTFMAEMKRLEDYTKAIYTLGGLQMMIYTTTGALCYVFLGNGVETPVLLAVKPLLTSKIALGAALPVIFISGSINTTVTAKYIMNRKWYERTEPHDRHFWVVWGPLIAGITAFSWVIAEAIPFFSALLGLISSLFASGFTFYFPALFWFMLIKKGKWNKTWTNIMLSALNALILVVGLVLLGVGTYASVSQIVEMYANGEMDPPFSC